MRNASEAASASVSEAIGGFTTNFVEVGEQASRDVKDVILRVQSSVAGTAEVVEEKSKAAMSELVSSVSQSSEDLEAAAFSLKKRAESIDLPPDVFLKQLSEPIDQLVQGMGGMERVMAKHVNSSKRLADEGERLSAYVTKATENVHRVSDLSVEQARSTTKDVEAVSARLQSLLGNLGDFSVAVDSVRHCLEGHVSVVNGFSGSVEKDAEMANRHRVALEAEVVEARNAVSRIYAELISAARALQDDLVVNDSWRWKAIIRPVHNTY